jgi:hypothetical protein
MSATTDLKGAMRHERAPTRRQIRAAKTRARALSPWRIGMSLLSLPVITVSVAVSIYIRTSAYEPPEAMAHLIARFDCTAARYVGLAPSYRGELGYHARNDADGDGVACEAVGFAVLLPDAASMSTMPDTAPNTAPTTTNPERTDPVRMQGGAKFVRP